MSILLLNKTAEPATPAADKATVYLDTVDEKLKIKNDQGLVSSLEDPLMNSNTVDQTISATTAYVAGSALAIPNGKLRVGTQLRWRLSITKTAAGTTAACLFLVKVGTAGTTADTTRLTFTTGTPTAAVDTAIVDIECIIRSIGATGVMQGSCLLVHHLEATGFSTLSDECLAATSAGFDMTVANLIVGLTITTTTASVWTVVGVTATADGV